MRDEERQHRDETNRTPARLVEGVRPPLVRRVEGRRLPALVWVAGVLLLVVVAGVLDWLVGGSYRATFLSGDMIRELEAVGQWGQFASIVIVLVCLDPARWRRGLDLVLAAGTVSLVVLLLKHAVGRLRPRHELPLSFDGWLVRIGEIPEGLGAYDVASMPSSHTSAAVVLSVFVALVWPRLSIFALVMACVVALSRVVFVAHWAADVVMGALVGFVIGYPIIRGFWGVRLVDALWRRLVDRNATPALPAVVATERSAIEKWSG